MGRKSQKVPGAQSYPLDPDLNPWEQQPNETPAQYERFRSYLDDENRVMSNHVQDNSKTGGSGQEPQRFSWGYRAYQYDLYMARIDEQDMVRYRRMMNHRHRQAARAAQAKVIRWLQQIDPTRLKPSDAVRLLDIAVRIERAAANVDQANRAEPAAEDAMVPDNAMTLHDILGSDQTAAAEVARTLANLEAAQR